MSDNRFNRSPDCMRSVEMDINLLLHSEGSCLVSFGNTKVLCTASVEERVPHFLRGKGEGWITAEYAMLPRATSSRNQRDSSRGGVSGRSHEIQRLIGRSLRSVVDLRSLGERQIIIDCDVLQADGGTRCAAITGGFVALYRACDWLLKNRRIKSMPIKHQVAAISCGLVAGAIVVDLDYSQDSIADVDANFVISSTGELIEVQATSEKKPFTEENLAQMIKLAKHSCSELWALQCRSLSIEHDIFPSFKV